MLFVGFYWNCLCRLSTSISFYYSSADLILSRLLGCFFFSLAYGSDFYGNTYFLLGNFSGLFSFFKMSSMAFNFYRNSSRLCLILLFMKMCVRNSFLSGRSKLKSVDRTFTISKPSKISMVSLPSSMNRRWTHLIEAMSNSIRISALAYGVMINLRGGRRIKLWSFPLLLMEYGRLFFCRVS